MDPAYPKSDFVVCNGLRLHYLDWGGAGPTLIFLTGMGSSAYIYKNFAPHFTARFRVLALTRRGHGDSDYPAAGYDADTLTEDLRQFMDQLQVDKAVLAGHSLAGVELTHFAATHPARVAALIYLDALDDRRGQAAVQELNPLRKIEIQTPPSSPHSLAEYIADMQRDYPYFAEIWSELWDEELAHGVKVDEHGVYVDRMPAGVEKMLVDNLINGYAPPQVTAPIPILAFFALGRPRLRNGYTAEQEALYDQFDRDVRQPFARSTIAEFQARFPQARIIVIPDGHHYCFIVQEELVRTEMDKFLLD